jgi:hypothetical protein
VGNTKPGTTQQSDNRKRHQPINGGESGGCWGRKFVSSPSRLLCCTLQGSPIAGSQTGNSPRNLQDILCLSFRFIFLFNHNSIHYPLYLLPLDFSFNLLLLVNTQPSNSATPRFNTLFKSLTKTSLPSYCITRHRRYNIHPLRDPHLRVNSLLADLSVLASAALCLTLELATLEAFTTI